MPGASDGEALRLRLLLRQQRQLVVEGLLQRSVVLARLDVGRDRESNVVDLTT